MLVAGLGPFSLLGANSGANVTRHLEDDSVAGLSASGGNQFSRGIDGHGVDAALAAVHGVGGSNCGVRPADADGDLVVMARAEVNFEEAVALGAHEDCVI